MAKDALEEGHSANLVFGKVSGHPSFLFSRASVLEVTHSPGDLHLRERNGTDCLQQCGKW